MITIGSLCSGAGMLDLAVEAHHGAKTIWFCENAPDPSLVLAERFPGVPNYGDLTTTDWDQVPKVDILTAGFPCQPISASGRQRGREDQRWIWDDIVAVIRTLRPGRVVLENVRNLLAIDEGRCMAAVVLGLAELGYLGRWGVVRASEAGAPHRRERVFIVADASGPGRREVPRGPYGDEGTDGGWSQEDGHKPGGSPEDAPDADEGRRGARVGDLRQRPWQPDPQGSAEPSSNLASSGWGPPLGGVERGINAETGLRAEELGRCDRGASPDSDLQGHEGPLSETGPTPGCPSGPDLWGKYWPAIERWEHFLGRPAPYPLLGRRVNARFSEWMLGLPEGWVTDIPMSKARKNKRRKSNARALRVIGNGVCVQQGLLGLRMLDGLPTPRHQDCPTFEDIFSVLELASLAS